MCCSESAMNVVAGEAFSADLGARAGLPARRYKFQRVFVAEEDRKSSKSYKDIMVAECTKHGMKPVCNQKSNCAGGLWLGQSHMLSHGSQRRTKSYYPEGWSKISDKWNGLCTFDSGKNGKSQSCDLGNTYQQKTKENNPNFMCGVVEMENGESLVVYSYRRV